MNSLDEILAGIFYTKGLFLRGKQLFFGGGGGGGGVGGMV